MELYNCLVDISFKDQNVITGFVLKREDSTGFVFIHPQEKII